MTPMPSIDRTIFEPLLEYAEHIVWQAPGFREFALACIDHLGEKCIPLLKSTYGSLYFAPFDTPKEKMNKPQEYENTTADEIYHWFKLFEEDRKRKEQEREFKDNVDELQFLVTEFRNSDEFQKMLDGLGQFKSLATYNAMLVQLQLPGACLVLTGKQWAKYNRRPKANARKLITLKVFGPIQCMFDYEGTEPIPGTPEEDEAKILEDWNKTLVQATGELDKEKYNNLLSNLPLLGILIDDKFEAVRTYGGYIAKHRDGILGIPVNKDFSISYRSEFIISINGKAPSASQFHTLCHELGHLFCKHMYYGHERRDLTLEEREFEAETVAWIVCKRQGIANPSEQYLAGYTKNGKIPLCSLDNIMKAVTKIEELMCGILNIKDSPWYKYDKGLKGAVDKKLADIKAQKSQGNLFSSQWK